MSEGIRGHILSRKAGEYGSKSLANYTNSQNHRIAEAGMDV